MTSKILSGNNKRLTLELEVNKNYIMKKKSPIKYDAGLVEAYRQARQSEVDAMKSSGSVSDILTDFSKDIFKKLQQDRAEKEKIQKAAKQKGQMLADEAISVGGSLGTNTFDASYDYVTDLQEKYDQAVVSGDKKETAKYMQMLNEYSVQMGSLKELNQTVANAISENDLTANVKPDSKEYAMLSSFMDKKTPVKASRNDEEDKNVFTYTSTYTNAEGKEEEFTYTSEDVENFLKENTTDSKSIADIRDQMIKAGDTATNENASGFTESQYDAEKMTAKMDGIIKKGNMNSLIYDDVLENGTPFAEAIYEQPEIKGMTYASLGLKTPEGDTDGVIGNEQGEPNTDVLVKEHKDIIIDAILNPKNDLYNEERTRGLMAVYFQEAIAQQYTKKKEAFNLNYYLNQIKD